MNELYSQIQEVQKLLELANADISKIIWTEHHPEYPESINNLMMYLARSDWMTSDYKNHKLKDVVANIKNATIDELKSAITTVARTDRWITGGWKKIMEERVLDTIVARAIEVSQP